VWFSKGEATQVKAIIILLVILAVFGLLVGGKFVGVRNDLATQKEDINRAWSDIDADLQRRADLIPNLVETVKGYAKHEQGTLEKVVQARSQAINASSVADKAQAETQLTSAVRGLLAIAEAYPDLKANQNFLALQEELTATENRIGFSRQHYNDVVTQFNQAIMQFPANIVAGLFGFHAADFFTLDPAEAAAVKQVPKVQF
jgi:LemA protein